MPYACNPKPPYYAHSAPFGAWGLYKRGNGYIKCVAYYGSEKEAKKIAYKRNEDYYKKLKNK